MKIYNPATGSTTLAGTIQRVHRRRGWLVGDRARSQLLRQTTGSTSSGRPPGRRQTSAYRGSRWRTTARLDFRKACCLTFPLNRANRRTTPAGSLAFGPGGELLHLPPATTRIPLTNRQRSKPTALRPSTNAPDLKPMTPSAAPATPMILRGKILRIKPAAGRHRTRFRPATCFAADGSRRPPKST